MPPKLAAFITKSIGIPTIGIGTGAGCNRQVLVYRDMLGMFSDYTPKFVKKYTDVGTVMKAAFREYFEEI